MKATSSGFEILKFQRALCSPWSTARICHLRPWSARYSELWGCCFVCPFMQKLSAEPGPAQLGLGLGQGLHPSFCPHPRSAREQYPEVRAPHSSLDFLHQSRHVRLVFDISLGGLPPPHWVQQRGMSAGMRECCGSSARGRRMPPYVVGEATQELGTRQSRLHLNWLPARPALEGCPKAAPSTGGPKAAWHSGA